MKLQIDTVGDFEKTIEWLARIKTAPVPTNILDNMGARGVSALSNATPRGETGETANGWRYEVSTDAKGAEVVFKNVAHPEAYVNVAKLIELGHATKNGGYVPPRPYIKQAVNSIIEETTEKLVKEMIE